MKAVVILCSVFLVCFMTSCGGDACTSSEWIGTYNKVSEDCPDGTVMFSEQIIITSSTTEGSVNVGGVEIAIDETNCSISLGGDKLQLDGSKLTVSSGACSAVFE